MSSRASLNKVLLIGNLTRDPELRYTPSGAAVCTFAVATNRTYAASDGTKREEAEFTKVVAWNKLAELCSQLLTKGRKVYVEGRLQTRSWETPDGQNRQTTEVVIDDMRILDSKKGFAEEGRDVDLKAGHEEAPKLEDIIPEAEVAGDKQSFSANKQSFSANKQSFSANNKKTSPKRDKENKPEKVKEEVSKDEEVNLDDLPF